MDYCRLCAKSDKKPLISILDNNPLKINEKIEKIFRFTVNRIYCFHHEFYVNSSLFPRFKNQAVYQKQFVLIV